MLTQKKLIKNITLVASIALLSSCSAIDSFNEVKSLNNTTAVGSPFTQALSTGYRDFANDQLDNHFDYPDALHFARKGLAAAAGETVLPEPVSDWSLTSEYATELATARGRLITVYDYAARESLPEAAATAQVAFDCWVEYQEEYWHLEKGDEIACKVQFHETLDFLENNLKAPEVEIVEPVAPPPADVYDIDPAEPMAPENAMYLVFFNWDSAKLGAGALNVVDAVSEEVTANPPGSITIIGHTDTSGPTDYNQRLAFKRAKAAKDALAERGVDPATMMTDAKGESDLLVPTPDNVREPANRRVNISFE